MSRSHRSRPLHRSCAALALAALLALQSVAPACAHGGHGAPMTAGTPPPSSWTPRIVAHAFLMCLVMLVLLPAGVILAFRGSHLHKWVQSASLALMLLAGWLAIADVSGEGHGHGASPHAKAGIATFVLLLVQGALGWAVKYVKNLRAGASADSSASASASSAESAGMHASSEIKTSEKDSLSPGAAPYHHARSRSSSMEISPGALPPLTSSSSSSVPSNSLSHSTLTPSFLESAYRWGALAHRILAAVLLLAVVPFTLVLGACQAMGIYQVGMRIGLVQNLAAHVGFGAGLVLGGLLFVCMLSEQRVPALQRSASFPAGRVRMLPLPAWMSAQGLEYAVWCFFGALIILTQHDWSLPLEPYSVDLQHVMIGTITLIASLCGLTLLALQRQRVRQEFESIATLLPASSTHFHTSHSASVQLTRLPGLVLYLGLGFALLNHGHGDDVFADHLHYAFGVYACLNGLSRLFGAQTKVGLLPLDGDHQLAAHRVSLAGGRRSPVHALLPRALRPKARGYERVVQFASTGSSAEDEAAAAAAMEMELGSLDASAKLAALEAGLSPSSSSSSSSRGSSSSPTPVAAGLPPAAWKLDWSLPDGAEGVGSYGLLSSFLLVLCGVTFSGSSDLGVLAAQSMLSSGLQILSLAVVACGVITWWSAICAATVAARAHKAVEDKKAHELQLKLDALDTPMTSGAASASQHAPFTLV